MRVLGTPRHKPLVMMFGSYTLNDIVICLWYVVLFIPVLLAPGYVLSWTFDLFSFRSIEPRWRFLASVPVSVAFAPVAIYWVGRIGLWPGVYALFFALFAVWLALLFGFWGHERPAQWAALLVAGRRFVVWAGAVWLVVAVASLIDIQFGNRLYFSVVTNDYAVRTAVTDAIAREGVIPSNPFYRLTGPVPLRYHYFWFLPCSLVLKWSGLASGARGAINASVIWCGWGLISLVPLYFRFFLGRSASELWRLSRIGIGLLALTGLDVVAAAWNWWKGTVKADMEWWNVGQVTSWINSLLWVPHNTAALVAGLTALLVMWTEGKRASWKQRLGAGLLAGCSLASMMGDSVYVAIVFAGFLCVWTLYLAGRREWKPLYVFCCAGLSATVLALPYLLSLAGGSAGATFMRFSVRAFTPADSLIAHLHLTHGKNLIYLFFLPLQYLLELGVFAIGSLAYLAVRRKVGAFSQAEKALFLLAVIPFLIATFFRSSVVDWSNDLGWRGFLPVQFVMLLWTAEFFSERRMGFGDYGAAKWKRLSWAALLAVGLASSLYGLMILRAHGMLADAGYCTPFFTKDRHLGELTFGLRQGYERLTKLLPEDAIVQVDPKWEVYDFFWGLYSHRATASFNTTCGVEYGGSKKACDSLYPEIQSVFRNPSIYNEVELQNLGKRLGASAFVVYNRDPAWTKTAWTAEMKPAVQNNSMRAYLLDQQIVAYSGASTR